MTEQLEQLYKSWSGQSSESISALPPSGSDRIYYRISKREQSVLGVFNPHIKENEAYFEFTRHFINYSVLVPKVLFISEDRLYYLIEDLGDDSLYKRVEACNGNLTPEVIDLYKKSLKQLVKMQVNAGLHLDYNYCYPSQQFDAQSIQWDLNYFKYNFLKLAGIKFDEYLLEKDFETLKEFLVKIPANYFMYRDFQTRNILIKDNEPWFIDFQGGRKGPLSYDLASILYQARARLPYEIRLELFNYYFEELNKVLTVDYDKLLENLRAFALLRTLQVLGAYGFRGYFEKKPHFIESIPFAIANLKFLLLTRETPIGLPHLKEIASNLEEPLAPLSSSNKLSVRVVSFSYRKGAPADPSGNGGGFVFDCRGIMNPGRFNEYLHLTGKDEKVIRFFKQETDIDQFIQHSIELIKPTIDSYINRKFRNLMISFGCTGGQHRSVYCAEQLVKYIQNNYDVHLVLWHREQSELIEYGN